LLAVTVALAGVGPQPVWADLQRLLDYVPGVGFVSLEDTRVLMAPVEVTRSGVTLRVEQVLARPDGTVIVIRSEGLPPEDQLWPHGAREDGDYQPRLRLSDGRTLVSESWTLSLGAGTLEFPPLPAEVYRVTLELSRLPLVPAGAAPETWEVPLNLRPATGALVEELFPQPYAPPDASDTHEGVTLHVLAVAHSPDETAVKLQVQWQDPKWRFPRIGFTRDVELHDDLGHVYQRSLAPSGGSTSRTIVVAVPEATEATLAPEPSLPTYEQTYAFSPVSLSAQRLTLTVEGIAFDIPAEVSFTMDLGDNPQVGDYWPLDVHLQVAAFPVYITGARLIEEEVGPKDEPTRRTVLQFNIAPVPKQGDRVLSGVGLDGEAAKFRGGSTGGYNHQTNTMRAGLVVKEGQPIPTGSIQVKIGSAELYLLDAWSVTWTIPGADRVDEASPAPVTLHPKDAVQTRNGLTLGVEEVVLTDRLTGVRVELEDPPPGVTLVSGLRSYGSIRHQGLALEDDRGQRYDHAGDVYWRPYNEPEPDLKAFVFGPLQPLARQLRLHVPAVEIALPAVAAFNVTVPEELTITLGANDVSWPASKPWEVDIPLRIGDYELHFSQARLEELNGTTLLTLTSDPYRPRKDDRWLSGLQLASVTAPDGRAVDLTSAFSHAGPGEEAGELYQVGLAFDVVDPGTGTVRPGCYHVKLDGVTVAVQGPWTLAWNLRAP
jgi:hypothetical protein